MAQERPTKHEYNIRDLSTRQVVLFPTRAHIIREVRDVQLKPGANQLIITGLSPMVDEHSVQVEGAGKAKITDLSVCGNQSPYKIWKRTC